MADKQKLVQEADEAFGELRDAISGLDEGAMKEVWLGTWGAREIVIHVSGWHRELIPAFGRLGRNLTPYPDGVSYDDFDAWNARFVDAKRNAKLPEILSELEASHRDYVTAASALPEELFATGSPTRELFEAAGAPHYREHAGQIRDWRERTKR